MKVNKAINVNGICDVNPFGVEAVAAAYHKGEKWLEELKYPISMHYIYLKSHFEGYLSASPAVIPEGIYPVRTDRPI